MSPLRTRPRNRQSAKRDAILTAATATFARFGYRKTSMDEVARAAGASRQGLYLHFPTKEELFRATVEYALSAQLGAATAALRNEAQPLHTRLVSACDEWNGRYVGVGGADAGDLTEASAALTGSILARYEQQFEQQVAQAVRSSPHGTFYERMGVPSLEVAKTLHAAIRGLKHSCLSHEEFLEGVRVAVRVLLAR
jgi:TetR/AcrR family transcriptional regulator, regulator of autoinduction and epiphytic fitness